MPLVGSTAKLADLAVAHGWTFADIDLGRHPQLPGVFSVETAALCDGVRSCGPHGAYAWAVATRRIVRLQSPDGAMRIFLFVAADGRAERTQITLAGSDRRFSPDMPYAYMAALVVEHGD